MGGIGQPHLFATSQWRISALRAGNGAPLRSCHPPPDASDVVPLSIRTDRNSSLAAGDRIGAVRISRLAVPIRNIDQRGLADEA
jgi:hypothetical protein